MATNYTSGDYQIVLATKIDTSVLKTQIATLNQNPPTIKIDVNITKKSLENVEKLNDLLGKTQALNNYTSALSNIQKTMKSYESIASKTVTATNKLAESTKNAKEKTQTFSDMISKFSKWKVVSDVVMKVRQSFTELINVSQELDSSFVNLQKVTNLTSEDFSDVASKAYSIGQEVAKTTTEVIDAMTEFARSGYTMSEINDVLAENALMWTNISDGTTTTAEAAEMIIAVMKAFNMTASESTHIIDSLNNVSNHFAISSGDLSNALSKSSSVLAASGTALEEQLGLITAGNFCALCA